MVLPSWTPANGSDLSYVWSVDPSSTNKISKFGWSTFINDCKVPTIHPSSLWAGIMMDTFEVSHTSTSLKASNFEVSRKAKNIVIQYLANVSSVKIKKKTGKISFNCVATL